MRARRTLALVASALVVAGATAGITHALWGQDASLAMPVVRSGNLALEFVGTPTWTETSPDVTPAHSFTMRSDQMTANHLATPGDTFTLRQQFRTVLTGDNLAARVNVRWTSPPSLLPADRVVATYVVTMPDGTSTAPQPVGSPLTVPAGVDNITSAEVAAWGTTPWSVTVTFAFTGTSSVVVAPTAVGSAPVTSLGTVVVELAQVRQGEGF
ncbi:hypothetical protein [Cellulomonas xiejunii]|uniref:Alternate-type signal peptide domain-containing protein n=1 Tax=Cellulomonas xiejunii TaxID=2968083 RepID=A0ABY5KKD9_9CELL|nr:hypothetical protein [Cellulomonas xiejunii]MCC2320474.1 hypothetical protein [Cellulomonas xiejunii]UUI70769.1 hypothetical protein NP048_13320 [Cellulomonas xiejunii]